MSARHRIVEIARVVFKARLYELLDQDATPTYLRWALWPLRYIAPATEPLAARTRRALEDLGPVFVKFGQLLSTRRDLLPPAFADEFALLQDAVPPFSGATARGIVEAELDGRVGELFAEFDDVPLASASVAQVHGASLVDGTQVCVKVMRPGIDQIIERDIALLHTMAEFADKNISDAHRLRLPEVVADYEQTIYGELDLTREAANSQRLRLNFADSPLLYVPRTYPALSTTRVLTVERIFAAPMGDIAGLRAAGTNLQVLAERGVETFFTQVFEHNFFHADMHPGNIFVDITDPNSPSWVAIDCAIMGELTEGDQRYLARNILAFLNQDYEGVARLHLESGWVPATTDLAALTRVIEEVCEPVFAKPLAEIEFGTFLITLFAAAQEFDLRVQPQLVLLQKTLLNIEGLGRQLYPQLDLWVTAKPFMEGWMAQQLGPDKVLSRFTARLPDIAQQLPQLPDLVATANYEIQRLGHLGSQQAAAIAALQGTAATNARRSRRRRLLGTGLVVTALVLLWRPLDSLRSAVAASATGYDGSTWSLLLGLVALAVGAALAIRA